uniref:Uncharacterized protein n=1 Tax=Romanomermis culicivorax TaxID=13658 RepID=A0A915HPS7_ROMCU
MEPESFNNIVAGYKRIKCCLLKSNLLHKSELEETILKPPEAKKHKVSKVAMFLTTTKCKARFKEWSEPPYAKVHFRKVYFGKILSKYVLLNPPLSKLNISNCWGLVPFCSVEKGKYK